METLTQGMQISPMRLPLEYSKPSFSQIGSCLLQPRSEFV
jgi:hypothetical protein